MATVFKCLVQGLLLPSAAAPQYTAPGNTQTRIMKLTLNNVSGAAVTVTIYLVPNGGGLGSASLVYGPKTIPAPAPGVDPCVEAYQLEGHCLNQGDSLQALCSVAGDVAMRVSGWESS